MRDGSGGSSSANLICSLLYAFTPAFPSFVAQAVSLRSQTNSLRYRILSGFNVGASLPLTVARAVAALNRLPLSFARLLTLPARVVHRSYAWRACNRMRVHQNFYLKNFSQKVFRQYFPRGPGSDRSSL